MVLLYANTVTSVPQPATLLILADGNQNGWCKQVRLLTVLTPQSGLSHVNLNIVLRGGL